MIYLIYQHCATYPVSELENCLSNIQEKLSVGSDKLRISIVIDGLLTDEINSLLYHYKHSLPEGVLSYSHTGEHVGITKARNKAVNQIANIKPLDKLMFCCTNSKWIVKIDDNLINYLESCRQLYAFEFKCEDWLYDRDNKCSKFHSLPIDYFLSVQNKPDYLMLVPYYQYSNSQEYYNEKYNPEDIDWYYWSKSGDGNIYFRDAILCECWFNSYGLTKTGLKNWREVELNNPLGFYEKAETFIDAFLRGEIVLNIRQLKDYCSTLVSSHSRSIPFKKYKGTIIEPLLIERLKSWAENEKYNNNFRIYEE